MTFFSCFPLGWSRVVEWAGRGVYVVVGRARYSFGQVPMGGYY